MAPRSMAPTQSPEESDEVVLPHTEASTKSVVSKELPIDDENDAAILSILLRELCERKPAVDAFHDKLAASIGSDHTQSGGT